MGRGGCPVPASTYILFQLWDLSLKHGEFNGRVYVPSVFSAELLQHLEWKVHFALFLSRDRECPGYSVLNVRAFKILIVKQHMK